MKTKPASAIAKQFEDLHGKKVLVMVRREPRKYVGTLAKEDPYFIYLQNAQLITGGKKSTSPLVAISKHIVGEVLELSEEA